VAEQHGCFACHTDDGRRHIGPTFVGLYGRKVTLSDGRELVANEAYLTRSMMEPMTDLVLGFPPTMPTFQGTLTAAEVAALVDFIKSLAVAKETRIDAIAR
jgi:cytochrome c oxidase subunit 2